MDEERQGKVALTAETKNPLFREPINTDKKRSRRKKLLCCCGVCCAITVVIIVLLIILVFTVFKQRDPTIHVDSVLLQGLNVNVGNIFTSPNLSVDMDLLTKLTVKNPNYAGFNYHNTTAFIYYQDVDIGNSPVPAGKVKARATAQLTTSTNVHISGSVINAQLTQDVAAGVLPIVTTVRITGTAKILGGLSINNVRTSAHCDINIFLANQTQTFHCDYKVKL